MNDDFLLRLSEISVINEEFRAFRITPPQLDLLLSDGWRHFGQHFFRYNFGVYENEIRRVIPLRIRLADFSATKSQKRVLRKNSDLQIVVRPIEITQETEKLFEAHKIRFKSGVPDSIFDFLDADAANVPCEALECAIYKKDKLIAVSYFDVSEESVSSIYGMFDPQESPRSLGIFTLLAEAEFAGSQGKAFHYLGYAYEGNSFYDYKKRFRALEEFDWEKNWTNFTE